MADFSTCPCLFRGLHRLAKRYILRRCSAQCTMYSLFRAHHDQSRRKMKNYVWSLSVRQGKTLAARNEITPGYLIWTATKYIWNQFVVKHTASHWRQRKQLSLLKGSRSDQQPSTEANKKECFALSLSLSLPPVLPPWHVKDPGHSAESGSAGLHLNTYTPLTQRSRSGLTMPLSRHSVGTYPATSSHATCQGTFAHSRLGLLSHCGLILV